MNKSIEKKDKDISTVLMGLLSFVLGGLLICATEDLLTTFNYVLVCIFAIVGVVEIISFFTSRDYAINYYNKLLIGCTFIWLALILYKYYMVIINILPILFSLYLFIMAAVMGIKYNLIKVSLKIKYKVYIVMAILAVLVGVLLIFEPLWSVYVYLKITGVYVVMLSMLFFYEFFKNIKLEKKKGTN
jgi:uncharacterized membrane protein HdeD (DUF308 family)